MKITNGMPSTAEEIIEEIWSEKDTEKVLINERLDEIKCEMEMGSDAHGEFLEQDSIMLKKVETVIAELKLERERLENRLRKLSEKQ